jgi:hypothetical protein
MKFYVNGFSKPFIYRYLAIFFHFSKASGSEWMWNEVEKTH